MLISLVQTAIGLALLLFSADYLVRGAVRLARRFGLSQLIIGLTVIAFGTSAPEFVTSLTAALEGTPAMAVGNVVGSNMANMLLILGVAAVLRPIRCAPQAISRDAVVTLGATALFIALAALGGLGVWHGLILLAALAGYLVWSYRAERNAVHAQRDAAHRGAAEVDEAAPGRLWVTILLLVAGLGGIVLGAELLVRGGTGVARLLGVSEAVIGLTLIALGTSLPELATVVVASSRGHGDVALGNVLGSNIFNLLGIAGGVAAITPLPVPAEIMRFDVWALLGVTALLLPLMLTGRRLSRGEGSGLLILYGGYVAIQFGAFGFGA